LTDRLENSLVLKELGFNSIWLLKKSKEEKYIYFAYTLNLNDCIILFVANANINSKVEGESLFKNIALYLQTQSTSQSLELSLSLDDIKIKEIIESSKCEHLFLLSNKLDFLGEEYQLANENKVSLSVSLSKMIENPESKQELWHDIQKLLNRVNGK
jgi:DNA polymerase III psi subunit